MRALAGAGVFWCLAFPVAGLAGRFHLFADGGLFAYAVAAGASWDFHWRQIPGRVAAWALASLPAETLGRVTGSPELAVTAYGLLLFAAPAIGLAVTWAADRGGVIRLWAAASTALLCPIVFGFPTELWFAHAAVWPALAFAWRDPSPARRLGAGIALAIVALSHEAGLIWAGVLVGALGLSPAPGAWRRAGATVMPVLAVWVALKLAFPADAYEASVLARNAWNLVSLRNLATPLTLLLAGALLGFALGCWKLGPWRAVPAGLVAPVLLWLLADLPVHAWDRYYLRGLLLGAVPPALLLAALHAAGRLPAPLRRLEAAVPALVLVVGVVHAVETVRFGMLWGDYRRALAVLVAGDAVDPGRGDADFVSTGRLDARFEPVAWHSTTPFLGALVSPGLAPRHLAVHPDANYFWFDCATASANAAADRALPARTRDLVRRYTCTLHPG